MFKITTTIKKYRKFIYLRIKSHYLNKVSPVRFRPRTKINDVRMKDRYKFDDEFGDFGIGTMIEANKNNPLDIVCLNPECGSFCNVIRKNNSAF